MHSGRSFAKSFLRSLNPSFSSNATQSCTNSAQPSPNGISDDCNIASESENQAGALPSITVGVELAKLDTNIAGAFLQAGCTFSGRDIVAVAGPEAVQVTLREGQGILGGFALVDAPSLSLLDLGSAGGGASFLLFLVWISEGDGAGVSDGTASGGMEGEGVWVSNGATWD